MIYWTDNHSEPKKINIERSKEGSKSWKYGAGWDGSIASIDPYTWPGCQRSEDIACYSDFDQHTKLIVEGEHIMDCENSTSTCYIYGCTDMTATNYNPNANYDDGSCIVPVPVIYGCDDGTFGVDNLACNAGMLHWSAAATGNQQGDYNTNDTNLCIFPDECEICEVDNVTGLNTGGVITDPSCGGCTDPNATNYDINAIFDDGSCNYIINPGGGGPGVGDPDDPVDPVDPVDPYDPDNPIEDPDDPVEPPTADCTPIDGGGNIEIADATGINGEPWNGAYPYVRHCPKNWIRPCEIVMSHPDFKDANGNTYQSQTMQGDDWVKTNKMTSAISPNNHTLFEAVNGHERLVHWRMAIKGTNSVLNLINRYFLEALTKEFNAGNLDAGSTLMTWNWGNDPGGIPTQTQATDGIAGKVSLSSNAVKHNLVKAVSGYYTKVFYNFQEIITFFNGLTANNGQPVLATPLTLANNILDLHETSNSGGPVSMGAFYFNNTGHINPKSGSTTNIASFSFMMDMCGHDDSPNWLTPSIETCENGVNKNEWDGISNAYLHSNVIGTLP